MHLYHEVSKSPLPPMSFSSPFDLVSNANDHCETRVVYTQALLPWCAAVSYPARLLSRAVNPLSNEVLEHVNAGDSIIVLYDWEGNTAGPACALLSEKGVENVMLLHGGEQLLSDAVGIL